MANEPARAPHPDEQPLPHADRPEPADGSSAADSARGGSTAAGTSSAAGHSTAGGLMTMVQRIVMGGVGTVSMTLDEINGLVQRLVGRGESVEAELTELVQEYVDQRSANGVIDLVPDERGREGERDPADAEVDTGTALAPLAREATALERSVETILVRLNVPTRTDIEELSHKIALLNDKVTRLRDARTSAAGERAEAATAAEPEPAAAVPRQRSENGKGG